MSGNFFRVFRILGLSDGAVLGFSFSRVSFVLIFEKMLESWYTFLNNVSLNLGDG